MLLGHDWIHTRRCVPSSLHQLLVQWVDEEVEIVHAETSAFISLADASVDWQHGNAPYLSDQDLSGYDFLNVTKDSFVSMSI